MSVTLDPSATDALRKEVARRRTFAIISHPDAGKTTLTEKTLLYAGAIELAGAVRGRKAQRAVVSDWMDVERERGISITSAALEFELYDCKVTLLDTPGHKDFSEDTLRTLLAVDSVVMVIDAAKGIETQTRKLFEVCRNKAPADVDVRQQAGPAEPRSVRAAATRSSACCGIHAAPINWPIGDGDRFKGVYDLRRNQVLLYERDAAQRPARRDRGVQHRGSGAGRPDRRGRRRRTCASRPPLVGQAGTQFDHEAYLRAEQTPVFFGSALSNFGLEPFLRGADRVRAAAAAAAVERRHGRSRRSRLQRLRVQDPGEHEPEAPRSHRVRARLLGRPVEGHAGHQHAPERAGARCRGRTGSSAASARRWIRAVAGDVVGLVNPGRFAIGDTLWAGTKLAYPPIPHFAAEFFGAVRLRDTRYKQFDEGVRQLEEEGLMQVVFPIFGRREPILGVVGALQFDVVAARLKSEYGVECDIDRLKYSIARWVKWPEGTTGELKLPTLGVLQSVDRDERPVLLFESNWELQYCERENPTVKFLATGAVA